MQSVVLACVSDSGVFSMLCRSHLVPVSTALFGARKLVGRLCTLLVVLARLCKSDVVPVTHVS